MDEDKKCDDRKYAGTVVLEKTSVHGKKGDGKRVGNVAFSDSLGSGDTG